MAPQNRPPVHGDSLDFPELLTVKEAATYLRVHTTTLYRLIKVGRIPAFRVGSDYRIVKKMLDKALMDSTNETYESKKGRKMRAAR